MRLFRTFLLLLSALLSHRGANSYLVLPSIAIVRAVPVVVTGRGRGANISRRAFRADASTSACDDNDDHQLNDDLLNEIRSMSVKEIKQELQTLKKSTTDVFEKEELVQRLMQARQGQKKIDGGPGNMTKGGSKTKEAFHSSTTAASKPVITAPLYLTTMGKKSMKVAAVNLDGGGITIEPSAQPYATIQIEVIHDDTTKYTLSLLLDTACSGFVLRPEVQRKYNMPVLQTPVSMTSAAGTNSATGLTQIQRFFIGGESFGPMPAAVQDIGALPSSLDGIIGLSFLQQFAAVELDFKAGIISLYKDVRALPERTNMVADSQMRMLGSLGIFTTDVYLGDRGPVSMLVDTGAACTLLNWKGVADLGLSRDSKQLSPLNVPVGAMGSDNIAIQLSHRLNVSSKLQLGCKDGLAGVALGEAGRLTIDIGQIPVIDNLQSQGVGGILGVDALMQCSVVRVSFRQPTKITLYR